MIDFKTYFYRLLEESPDSTSKNGLSCANSDARSFAIADSCIMIGETNWMYHYNMFTDIQEHDRPKATVVLGELPHEIQYGRVIAREIFLEDFPEGLLGRVWLEHNEISFWNKAQAFTTKNIGLLNDMFNYLKINPEKYEFDMFGSEVGNAVGGYVSKEHQWKLLTWEQVQSLPALNHKTTGGVEEWQKKLHTMPPEIKGPLMKQMGMKGLPAKYKRDLADKLKMIQGD
jgi:hypothetical protein